MSDNIAIKVDGVSKDFVLPHEKVSSMKSAFTHFYKRRHKRSERQQALRGINFEVKQGEFFGIVGRNGSGKSTLLKILAGIYQPTNGKVRTYGRLVPFIELGVGFNPELSGRDNVYLNGALFGFSKEEVDAMYDEIVAFAELERFMDQKLKNYSSGMQVRLAFSLAVKADADILLIDEVLAVGDTDFQRKCFHYFKQLKKAGKTVVFVTHDMDAVREYCDRAMLIDQQKIVYEGTADEAAQEYMKLMNSTGSAETSETTDRWGDGAFTITDVKVERLDEESLVFSYLSTAQKDCDDPVYGFRIRNNEGHGLAGSNSLILGDRPKPVKAGTGIRTTWKVSNIFSDGTYLLDPSVVYDNTTRVADWWDGSLQFTIARDRHIPYLAQPEINLKTEER